MADNIAQMTPEELQAAHDGPLTAAERLEVDARLAAIESGAEAPVEEAPSADNSKSELVAFADEHGIDSSGTKAEIADRIALAMQ